MESLDRVNERLDNLEAVAPMLGALRLVALGSWQAAQKRRRGLGRYVAELVEVMPFVVERLPGRPATPAAAPQLLVAIGTERGLIGRFVEQVAAALEGAIDREDGPLRLHVFGGRLDRQLRRAGRVPDEFDPLPVSGLPDWAEAAALADGWWRAYRAGELDGVTIVHQAAAGLQGAAPRETMILPFVPPAAFEKALSWPPPILETDPAELAAETARLWVRAATYEAFLLAAEAEHVSRYQLLEAAVQNADRLQEELTTQLRSARQQAITREMQELVVGAGMLGSAPPRNRASHARLLLTHVGTSSRSSEIPHSEDSVRDDIAG